MSQITTLLPQPGDYFDNELNVMMPSLSRATQIADKTLFSSFAGVILMANLHRRCHNHFQAFESHDSTDGSKYDYWRWHYYLDKELSFYANQLLDHVHPFSRLGDPMALCLHTYLSAIQITLHEHAIKIIQAENLPGSLETESHNQCINSALKVATYAQCTSQMQDTKVSHRVKPTHSVQYLSRGNGIDNNWES